MKSLCNSVLIRRVVLILVVAFTININACSSKKDDPTPSLEDTYLTVSLAGIAAIGNPMLVLDKAQVEKRGSLNSVVPAGKKTKPEIISLVEFDVIANVTDEYPVEGMKNNSTPANEQR